jgi:protoporphyrin/coproporphyrin ferrochelatase
MSEAKANPHAADTAPAAKGQDIGILLVNLGTPDAKDFWSVRRYLKEFLSDPRVIETPRWLWWPILNFIVLTTRPQRSAKAYAAIWNEARDESPLRTISRAQAEALADWIANNGLGSARPHVAWAMRYGTPAIAAALQTLDASGCTRVLVLPLYPQYSATTNATVADMVFAALARRRAQPALRIAPPYYAAPAYIDALARSLRAFLATLAFTPDVILVSFHGMPQAYVDKGDPYARHCEETLRLLRDALGQDGGKLRLTYQSRFGPTRWLQPYTDATIKDLAREKVENLVIMAPGFVADCLETLEENAIENRRLFLENGGKNFAVVPCLNDSPEGMGVICDIVARELAGWL